MYVKLKNCKFCLDRVSFLEYVVTKDYSLVDLGKVDVVAKWRSPSIMFEI